MTSFVNSLLDFGILELKRMPAAEGLPEKNPSVCETESLVSGIWYVVAGVWWIFTTKGLIHDLALLLLPRQRPLLPWVLCVDIIGHDADG